MKRMLIAILSLAPIADSRADIYKYVAPDGRVYYTDEPKKVSTTA